MEENNIRALADKSFGNILSDGFNLFAKTYWKLILPLALFQIISIVLRAFLLSDLYWLSFKDDSLLSLTIFLCYFTLDTLIGVIFNMIAMSSVSSYVYKRYTQNDKPDFVKEFKKSFNKRLILVILILGIIMGLALSPFVLFFPGIIIFGFYIFLVYTYNMDDTKENPISAAQKIAKGSFWNIIFVITIVVLITFMINTIYEVILLFTWNLDDTTLLSWYNPDSKDYVMIILYELTINVITIIFTPLFICLLTPLFARCKARNELGPQYQHSKRYPPREQSYYQPATIQRSYSAQQPYTANQPYVAQPSYNYTWESRAQQDAGLFCPYCGQKINNPKKFCPNCGKSIEFE